MRNASVSPAAVGWFLAAAVAAVALSEPPASRAQGSLPSPSPCPTTWCVKQLIPGVTWLRRTAGLPSGVPQVNVVDVDPAFASVRAVETKFAPSRYETVPEMANDVPGGPALAAINGGYFQNNLPPPKGKFAFDSMLKIAGAVVAPPVFPAPALGLGDAGFAFATEPVAPDPLAGYRDAVSAGPFVVMPVPVPSAGVPTPAPGSTPFFLTQSFACAEHPRSAAWLRSNGHLMLGAFDGSSESSGLWLDTPQSPLCSGSTASYNGVSLGQFILQNFSDTVQALNLDGGGSTTFAVHGVLVNVPTNDSSGAPRPVIDGLMVVPFTGPARR